MLCCLKSVSSALAAVSVMLVCCSPLTAQTDPASREWSPVKDAMSSRWAKQITPDNVWAQYPRPQMRRSEWTNLNGLWDYAVSNVDAEQPDQWTGKILVPFAIESPLSGVGRRLTADDSLWYRTTFDRSDVLPGDRTSPFRIHFEAVDYRCNVWLNGRSLGEHVGGNLPFSFLVEDGLQDTQNELVVKVVDATDATGKYQLRGKQKVENRGIFYTPVSGIWQTVWIEPVAASHIVDLKVTGDAGGNVVVQADTQGDAKTIRVVAKDKQHQVAQSTSNSGEVHLAIDDAKLWSPDSPFLYDLQIDLLDDAGRVVDSVGSYVGLRTVGKQRDANGDLRLTLNGEEIFHWGPLDQGWWPGGLLTPPSDEAIRFEIDFLQRAGFNMIRKHIKVEPRRYYYHCDRAGMLVWQDQVEGGAGFESGEWPKWQRLDQNHEKANLPRSWKSGDPLDATWPDGAHQQFMTELKGMVDHLYNHPSIVTWVPFNERWGQHRTMEVGQWIVDYDPTRHVNIASGGNFFAVGDMADEHVYPHPNFPVDDVRYHDFVKIVGEFGGHGWPVPGHLWRKSDRNWGYGGLPKTKQEYIERYKESIRRLADLKQRGVAGAVYTQTTDVEGEINGLMTYDREVIKIAAGHLKQIAVDAGLISGGNRLTKTRPNIIIVLVDDMGYSDLGCYGGEIETPHIDALAADGLRFTQFYNQGRCCPTRASLITGLQPHRVGIGHMTAPPGQPLGFEGPYQGYLNDNCTTLAEVLKSADYTTLMTGKWHLGADRKECWPLQRGFDKYFGCISGAINYFKPGGDRGLTEGNEAIEVPEGFYATDTFTDKAIEYIDGATESGDAPFFLYLAYNAPHWPLNAKWEDYQKYRGKYKDGWRAMMKARNERQRELGLLRDDTTPAEHPGPQWNSLDEKQRDRLDAVMAAYAGCVDSIDQNIGKLVGHLKAIDQLDNTVIFLLSDNGACQEGGNFGVGDEAMVKNPPLETTAGVRIGLHWAGACNTPYRKYKHYVHEGGACTPMIAHWPAGIAEKDRGTLMHRRAYLQDFMTTVIDLAGGSYPQGIPECEGQSLAPLLAGTRQDIHFDPMYWEHEGNAAVRMGKWKLVREYEKPWELYDFSKDRNELNDLSKQKPVLREDMIQRWESWATETGVAFPKRFNMYQFLNQKKKQDEAAK
ncbi:sulfatase-like hydrolase/transferase [Stieleria sp. ICT_E10.1]|uniref:sulfatase-like hydrolase/transferase n=1 Tax=Stieleria sedimenti TaxID=2976331 RepID=UPI00218051B4|nr:sulfatase-like hydrolase/transferase [Stieleria sedimenti]MCS7467666.1 sulfatase-like hydrolase/transferase [Stieleria sedimenti]